MVFEIDGELVAVSREGSDVVVVARDFVGVRRSGVWRFNLPVRVTDEREPVTDRALASRLFREARERHSLIRQRDVELP